MTVDIEQIADNMCQRYCKYPLIWDERVMEQELSESEVCARCPMTELIKSWPAEPLGRNPYQE